jgi:uncharacterized protein YfaS (alpha-2-macroglobulin family)
MRDDRLLIFGGASDYRGRYVHRYVTRAVTRGRFALPAVRAECMYDPSILSKNGAGWLEVVEPPRR